MTLEGRIDRNYLPTREKRGELLVLRDTSRPVHEAKWLALSRNSAVVSVLVLLIRALRAAWLRFCP